MNHHGGGDDDDRNTARQSVIRWVKRNSNFVSAFCASTCSVMVGHPLDNLKTRMQAFPFGSMGECAANTMKNEGFVLQEKK